MPRQQLPLRPIQVDYICDECGKGYYRYTSPELSDTVNLVHVVRTGPKEFEHVCTNCGHKQNFVELYPTTRYAKEGELLDLDNYEQVPLCP